MPSTTRSAFATAPAATWTAVWRAEARSSALRTSSWPYLRTPARSACPGRGSVTGLRSLPAVSPSGGQGLIPHVQFAWSTFRTTSVSGVPSVRAVAQAGEHLHLVGFELLARAAAVALLAAAQVGVDRRACRARARPGAR